MQTLGLIPARIGSSEVKRKNIRPLAGKPLVAHAIRAALESGLDRIVVSTDSEEVAAVARAYGAEVPFMRPAALASNEATAMSVVRNALAWLDEDEGWRPDAVAYLQPTSPLRTAHHIDEGLHKLKPEVDSVVSVVAVDQHPFYMFEPDANGGMHEYLDIVAKPERRQDLPPLYCSNPVVLMSWTRYLLDPANEHGLIVNHKNFAPLIIGTLEAIDINNERDFRVAEEVLRAGPLQPVANDVLPLRTA